MRLGDECGQRGFLTRSWYLRRIFRRISLGFAVGPIMAIHGK